ncbi:MAG: hypothetical protein AB7K24_03355, partial [Gemmataceae bacterium]
RIARWDDTLGPPPTQQQLEAVGQEQIDALPAKVAARNNLIIRAHIAAEIDSFAALRDSGATWSGATSQQKDALIARLVRDVEFLGRLVLHRFDRAE